MGSGWTSSIARNQRSAQNTGYMVRQVTICADMLGCAKNGLDGKVDDIDIADRMFPGPQLSR